MSQIHRTVTNDKLSIGKQFFLSMEESHHIYNVRRIKKNETVIVRDVTGRLFLCIIENFLKRQICLKALKEITGDKPQFEIAIATAIPKSKRVNFLIEKLSELGVTEIIPLVCHYSTITSQSTTKIQRWQRIAQEAFKQSGNNVSTKIENFMTFCEAVEKFKDYDLKIILHPAGDSVPLKNILDVLTKSNIKKIAVMVGPEGGFSNAEIAGAVAEGFLKVELVKNILRIETAAICVVSFICIHRLS